MVTTTVELPADLKRDLEELARRTGRSESELHREALGLLLAYQERPRPSWGYGRSTDGRNAEETDEMLAGYGFGEE